MKETTEEIYKEETKLQSKQLNLEIERGEFVTKKKTFTKEIIEIDAIIQDYNNKISHIKLKLISLKKRKSIVVSRFDERKVERLLHQTIFTLKGIKNRGIALDLSEEMLIKDIGKLLD